MLLSDTVGILPIHLYHKTATGREQAKGHPCSGILAKPNDYLNRSALLHPYDCEPILSPDDELFYRINPDAKTRSEYYKNMNIVGALSANEIRSLEDMNSYEQAYEELEAQQERITGKWMYAEYDTFRRVYKRWLKKEKRSPK